MTDFSRCWKKGLVLFAVLLLCSLEGAAQERQAGTVQSPKGLGLFYERAGDSPQYASRFLFFLDFDGILQGETRRPGFLLGYLRHCYLPVYSLADGTEMDFFYGPGAVVGAVRDGKDFQGPVVALRGAVGLRFNFPERPFSLAFGWSADLGLHMQRVAGENTNVLRLYRGGLRRAWLPEIHLSYRF